MDQFALNKDLASFFGEVQSVVHSKQKVTSLLNERAIDLFYDVFNCNHIPSLTEKQKIAVLNVCYIVHCFYGKIITKDKVSEILSSIELVSQKAAYLANDVKFSWLSKPIEALR